MKENLEKVFIETLNQKQRLRCEAGADISEKVVRFTKTAYAGHEKYIYCIISAMLIFHTSAQTHIWIWFFAA